MTSGVRFVLAMALVSSFGMVRADDTKEPPVKYRLEVDGKVYPAVEGEAVKITGTLMNPTVKIVAEPFREFGYGGVSFQYPRAFTFEADVKDRDYKSWILSGNDFKIMYFLLDEKTTPDSYADEMIKQFGQKNATKSAMKSDVLGGNRDGVRIDVTLAGHKMTMDILCVPFAGGTRVIVLQDAPKSGQSSPEAKAALPVLKKTWAVK
jgi:hypothetical protein